MDNQDNKEEIKKDVVQEEQTNEGPIISFDFKAKKENSPKNNMSMQSYMIIGIVIVLALILIIAIGSLAMGKDEEVVNDEQQVEQPVQDNNDSEFDEEDAKKIYNESLPFVDNELVGTNIYYIDKVTVNNADQSFLRAFAFSKIEFKDGDIKARLHDDGTEMCAEEGCTFENILKQGWYTFDSTLLQEKAKYLYGAEIENGPFSENIGSYTTYNNGIYEHGTGGGTPVLSYHYREYVSHTIVEDTLHITDKYIYIYGTLDKRGENYQVTIYGDSAKKNKIGSGTYIVADNLAEFIVPTYDRKKVVYEHEFKKAEDGHWYWVSTKPVK